MTRNRPATTGYERLAQADLFSDSESEADEHGHLSQSYASLQPQAAPRYAPISRPRPHSGMATPGTSVSGSIPRGGGGGDAFRSRHHGGLRRGRSNSGVDLKAINARLERWAEEIASKFKRGRGGRHGRHGDGDEEERPEIVYSVFQAPDGVRPATAETLAAMPEPAMSRDEFDRIVESVRSAIDQGMHPSMITQGSSGSYFARNADGKIVGVFKPKDEEPYAAGNPKWNKWIHRNLFPCFFGRACLIPNLSYVSEAAAYTLDSQLHTNLVPHTEVVWLSSKSFHYPFWDRRAFYRKKKPLPAKPGSFQVFLKGFKDANVFLRENPWPEQYWSGFRGGSGSFRAFAATTTRSADGDTHRHPRRRWADSCRPSISRPSSGAAAGGGADRYESDDDEDDGDYGDGSGDDGNGDEEGGDGRRSAGGGGSGSGGRRRRRRPPPPGPDNFVWTETLKQSFREELEKLVILDYIMRNTDRGLDNWMIKVDWETQAVSIASEPPQLNMDVGDNGNDDDGEGPEQPARPVDPARRKATTAAGRGGARANPYRSQKPMDANGSARGPDPKISIGAIDNSLSWPWKHPDAWRSFPFGWLFLPVDLIGRPFSQKTRDHFLPLLTSSRWWSETQYALRKDFQMDQDFQEKMFLRQMAVMKGQAWNVVETLKTPDHGPLELTRRPRVCVWDDLVDVPVAVPMRATSSELRRKAKVEPELREAVEEEMDIGAASSSPTAGKLQGEDLLGLASPLPHPGRFELTSPKAQSPERAGAEGHSRSAPNGNAPDVSESAANANANATTQSESRPSLGYVPRASYQGPSRPQLNLYTPRRERRFSFGVGGSGGARHGGHGNSNSIAQRLHGYDEDDMEGDLGYAAAEDMEGNRRKVIVERLETVKSRNPVFSWC